MYRTLGIVLVMAGLLFANSAQAAIVGAYSTTVDFNSPTDLNDFTSLGSTVDVRPVSQSNSLGSNGVAGRMNLDGPYSAASAGQRVVYYTPSSASNGLIQLPALGTVMMSADFLATNATNNATPRIGLHENNTDNFADNSGWNHFMVLPRGGATKTLTARTFDAGVVTQDEGAMDITLTNGNWYRMGFLLTKSDTADTFTYDAFLASLDGSGNIASILRTEDGSFTNSVLYDVGFYSYMNFQAVNTGSFVVATAFDNFNLTVTGAPIPEPSTAMMLMSALLGSCIVRRRKK